MARGDVAVISISAALAVVVAVAVAYSFRVLDKNPDPSAMVTDESSSWLVLTWAPSFCLVEPSNPACTSGEVKRAGPTMLLHGLWPQPPARQNCGVPQGSSEKDLPPVDLSSGVDEQLDTTLVDAASLIPHEWYTHGTCSGVSPDVYFRDAATLTGTARTVLDPMFADAAGGSVTLTQIRERADAALGPGAGERIGLGCRKTAGEGSVVVELRMSLPPVVELGDGERVRPLRELLAAAPPMPAQCRHGRIPG